MPRRLTVLIATTVPAALLAAVPLAPAPAQPAASAAGGCRTRRGRPGAARHGTSPRTTGEHHDVRDLRPPRPGHRGRRPGRDRAGQAGEADEVHDPAQRAQRLPHLRPACHRPLRGAAHRPAGRPQRAHRAGPGSTYGPARDHQPPQRRPGLLRPPARALPLPGGGGRRAVQPAGHRHAALQVDRPAEVRPAALRPQRPAQRRRDDHDRPGRAGAVHRAARGRLPGPRPLRDPHPLPARPALDAVEAAAAVQRQDPDPPRRQLRVVVHAREPAAGRLLRHPARGDAGPDAELPDGAGPRLRRDLDRAGQHRAQLQRRDERRVAADGQGAVRRALRHHPLHDRHRLLRAARSPSTRWRTPTPASTRAWSPPAPTPTR